MTRTLRVTGGPSLAEWLIVSVRGRRCGVVEPTLCSGDSILSAHCVSASCLLLALSASVVLQLLVIAVRVVRPVMLSALLRTEVSEVLTFLGVMQLVAVSLSLLWLFGPLCCWRSFPTCWLTCGRTSHEPRVRMVRWLGSRTNKWVLLTKVVGKWYPKSISEYSGARGSTQHQVLAAATAVSGTLQVAIAILLWVGSYSTTARMVVLIVGGVACVFIGQMESAINWEETVRDFAPQRPPELSYFGIKPNAAAENRYILAASEVEQEHRRLIDAAAAVNPLPAPGTAEEIIKPYIADPGVETASYSEQTERRDKSLLSGLHMLAALAFIGCTFTAEGIMNRVQPHDFDAQTSVDDSTLSFVLAMTGVVFFTLFSLMSWLSGNYDEGLGKCCVSDWAGGSALRCLQARRVMPCCVRYQRYPGHSGVQFQGWRGCCCACNSDDHVQRFLEEVASSCYEPNAYDRTIAAVNVPIPDAAPEPPVDGREQMAQLAPDLSHFYTCCDCLLGCRCRRPRAAWLGVVFIVVETVAFGMLVASVAAEAIWA